MPKKKKYKAGDRDEAGSRISQKSNQSLVGKSDRQPGMNAGPGENRGDEDSDGGETRTQDQELRYLQDMFEGKLDPVVVHMIMNDCDFKVETALETLFKLVDQTTSFEAGMFRRSGFQDVYIPEMKAEENSGEDGHEEELLFATGDDPHQPQRQRIRTSENYPEEGRERDSLNSSPRNLNIPPNTGPLGAHTVDKISFQAAAHSQLTEIRINESKDGDVSANLGYLKPDLQGSSAGSAAAGSDASGPASNSVSSSSDDLETLYKKMLTPPDKSTERIETTVSEQLGEKSIDPSSTVASSTIPLVTEMGPESSQRTSTQSTSFDFRAEDYQPTPFMMEGWKDGPKNNLDATTSAFVPTAFTSDHRQAPLMRPHFTPSRFQSSIPPRHLNRMPRPAGRASILQRHLRPHDGQPFFPQKWNPRGVDPPQAAAFSNYPPPSTLPLQPHHSTGKHHSQMNSKPSSLAPSWLQNQEFSKNSTRQFEVGEPPRSYPTNLSHEGVSQHPPKWPIGEHPKYAQGGQGNSRKRDLEEKVIPLPGGKVLCLMRGCPGSGKSTLARKLVGGGMILSTDDYFMFSGKYKFDVTKLSDAHDWSHQKCEDAMTSGVTPVVIDNTNIERWTMKPYVVMAINHNYSVVFREPTTPWKFKIGKLFKYNSHNVPRDRISVMIERFEKNVTVENILGSSKPKRKKTQDQDNDKHSPKNKKGRGLKKERDNFKVADADEKRKIRKRNDKEDDEKGLKDKQEEDHEGSRPTVQDSAAISKEPQERKEQEASLSEDEMFVSDEENNIDTFLESMTRGTSQGAEMQSGGMGSMMAPLTDDEKEDAKMTESSSSEEQLGVVGDGEVSTGVATHSPNQVKIQTEISNNIEDDDIIAMVKYISETSYKTPNKNTQEDAGKDEERLESVGDEDLEAVISSITQGSYVPPIEQSSASPILHQRAVPERASVWGKEVTVHGSDNFVIHLPEPSAQSADGDVNEQYQDEVRRGAKGEDLTTETTVEVNNSYDDSGVSCETIGQQNPDVAAADIRQDRQIGDEAATIALSQGGFSDPSNSQTQLQDGQSAKPDTNEDQDDFSAVMTEVADAASVLSHELTEIEHQESLDNSKVAPGTVLGASEELARPHDGLNEPDDKTEEEEDFSAMMNELKDAGSVLSHELKNIEKRETSEKDDIKDENSAYDETDTLAGRSNLKETAQISPHTQEQGATLTQEIKETPSNGMRKTTQGSLENNNLTGTPSSSKAVPSIEGANQNGKVSSSPCDLTATSPSCIDHPDSGKHPNLTPLTPSPSSTPRNQSPSPLISPLSQDKTAGQHCQEKKKVRRSKSNAKGTKMAAVFPKLPPGTVDWSELADAGGSDVGRTTPEKPRSSPAESVSVVEAGTNTLPSDFSCLQRLSSGKISEDDVEKKGFRVVTGQARELTKMKGVTSSEKSILGSALSSLNQPENNSPIPASIKLHQSTMTDTKSDTSGNLEKLSALFPSIPQVDLEDILLRCGGDLEWATNILLDDFSNSDRSQPAKQESNEPSASKNPIRDDSTPSGIARSQDKDADLVRTKSNQKLSSDGLDQNLASSMISVVDDILKSISSGEIESAPSGCSPSKQETFPGVNTSHDDAADSVQYSNQLDILLRELDPRNLAIDIAEVKQDSFSKVGGPPQLPQQDDGNASQKSDIPQEEKQTLKDSYPVDERLEDKDEITSNGDHHPETLLNENKNNVEDGKLLEGCSQEEADPIRAPPLAACQRSDDTGSTLTAPEIKHDFLEETSKGGSQTVAESQGATPKPRREQVVRPKTASRSASMRSHSEPQGDKVENVQARMNQDSSPLRRDLLEAAGGVPASWKQKGEEEFSVPRPEQMMTGQGETGEMGDGEVSSEEKTDINLQAHAAQTKKKELSSLKEGLMLQLDPAFALQLQEMFGSAGFHLIPDGLPAEDLQVHVDYDLAKQLHTLWAQTLKTRFEQEEDEVDSMIKADEELARRLQQLEDINHMAEVQTARLAMYQEPKASPTKARKLNSSLVGYGDNKGMMDPLSLPRQPAQETTSLKEIMDEQLAVQLSKDVEDEEKLETDGSVSIATKLKKDKLFEEFPTIDRGTLEDIFRANNFQLEPTVRQVRSFFMSASDQPKDVYTDEALAQMERRQIEQAERESLASSSEGTDDSTSQEGSCFQSVRNPDYVDYRAEATQHYQQRHEAFQKAAAAYKQGLKDLASFYSQQGHLHTEKMKEANERASDVILTSRNSLFSDNTLDLHGLHVDEALLMLNKVLDEKKSELEAFGRQPHPPVSKPPPRHMFIITGKGNHSRGGVPRIRPAVTDLLKRAGYSEM